MDSEHRGLVTIGITAYNAEDTVVNALSSALAQDYDNIEIIVCDDCSSDRTVRLIRDYIKGADRPIRLIEHSVNLGQPGALNSILSEARGDYIAWFDDDDVSHESRITRQLQRIKIHESKNLEQPVACWSSVLKKYPNGYQVYNSAIGASNNFPVGKQIFSYHLHMRRLKNIDFGSGTPACSLMAPIKTFRLAGNYDTNLRRTDDTDFAIRLGVIGGAFVGTKEPLVTQFHTKGNDKTPALEYAAQILLLEKHKGLFDSSRDFQFAVGWRRLRYFYLSRNYILFAGKFLLLAVTFPVRTLNRLDVGLARFAHDFKQWWPKGRS